MDNNIIKISEIHENVENNNNKSKRSNNDSREGIINKEGVNTFNIRPYIGFAGLIVTLMLVFIILYIVNNKKVSRHIKKTLKIPTLSKKKKEENKYDNAENSEKMYSEFNPDDIKNQDIIDDNQEKVNKSDQKRTQKPSSNNQNRFNKNNNSFKYKKGPKDIYRRRY